MGQTTTPQVCRIAVIGPRSRVDLCVPVHVPLVDLLPAVVAGLGPDVADLGLDHDGWVLQRLGEEPLDDDRTPADLGLRDGDTLHLRPRAAQLPPLDFDDLVDGVATGIRQRAAAWDAGTTRLATASAAVVAALAGTVALLRAGLDDAAPAGGVAAAGVLAVALVLTVGARLAGGAGSPGAAGGTAGTAGTGGAAPADRAGAATAAAVAVALAGASGPALLAVTLTALDVPTESTTTTAQVLAAAASALLVGVLAALTQGAARAHGVALAATALGLVAATAAAVAGATGPGVAAVVALAAVALRPAVPQLAFRLAGLRLDPLPATAEDLQRGVDPLPGAQVLADTARAEAIMTALYAVVGALALTATVPLVFASTWAGPATAATLAASLLLASRPLVIRGHRAALAVPGLLGLAACVATADLGRSWLLGGALVASVGAAAALGIRPGLAEQRLSPSWGRAGDLAHWAAGAAVVPLALHVLGTFAAVRELVS